MSTNRLTEREFNHLFHTYYNRLFSFCLLKDETGTNKAAVGYNLTGIPAKFVIDKSGNIRFRSMGAGNSGEDAFLLEMDSMIEMVGS